MPSAVDIDWPQSAARMVRRSWDEHVAQAATSWSAGSTRWSSSAIGCRRCCAEQPQLVRHPPRASCRIEPRAQRPGLEAVEELVRQLAWRLGRGDASADHRSRRATVLQRVCRLPGSYTADSPCGAGSWCAQSRVATRAGHLTRCVNHLCAIGTISTSRMIAAVTPRWRVGGSHMMVATKRKNTTQSLNESIRLTPSGWILA
jgi:hypothetical protein